jgi:DNA sulfur modification protein DndC
VGAPLLDAIDATRVAIEANSKSHWIVGFSGGKDSTAVLKIFASSLRRCAVQPGRIDVIYCDTGVENPALDRYVKALFRDLNAEFQATDSAFQTQILMAPIAERFFVKIIGRGYPPPTNSFRWCTKSLRIKPVARFISDAAREDTIVALGVRRGESVQRDRSLNGSGAWQTQEEAGRRYRLFLPILNLDVADVWDAVFALPSPKSIQPKLLEQLYRNASGECPVIKSPQAAPCASGRFGCWTCTVVRRDRSSEFLIEAGHKTLKPYLEFRNWLATIRNDPTRRWSKRRNGAQRLGPFTLKARLEILQALQNLEQRTAQQLLLAEELEEIRRLWELDRDLDETMDWGKALKIIAPLSKRLVPYEPTCELRGSPVGEKCR